MSVFKNMITEKLELIITVLSILLIMAFREYGEILSITIVILYLRVSKNRKELLKSIGVKRPKNLFTLVTLCLFLGVLIELTTEIFFNPIIEKLTGSKIDLSAVDLSSIEKYLTWMVAGFVLGGLMEEVLFRGFLITRISKFLKGNKTSDLFALIATSILFGLCHLYQGWSGVISTGLVGLMFGIIFLAFNKNLWYSILAHGFVNMTALTILYFGYYDKLKSLIF